MSQYEYHIIPKLENLLSSKGQTYDYVLFLLSEYKIYCHILSICDILLAAGGN